MELYAAGSFRRESVFLRDYFNLPVLKLWAVLQVPRSISSIDGQLLAIKILCTLFVKAHSHVPYKKNKTYQRNFVLWRHLLFTIWSLSKLVACSQLATSSPGKKKTKCESRPHASLVHFSLGKKMAAVPVVSTAHLHFNDVFLSTYGHLLRPCLHGVGYPCLVG